MRLLKHDEAGNICSIEFRLGKDLPPYAILSHTWGDEDDEVNFQDLMDGKGKSKLGYKKIQFCGHQARRDSLEHFWVDTCCINKSNSTELQEAINCMYRWYANATNCYVYLADVSRLTTEADDDRTNQPRWKLAFRKSRWFTRGWTLQELIAPTSVEFFSKEGTQLGSKSSLKETIHDITRIPLNALQGSPLSSFSIPERMTWIEGRTTTRGEDMAYSLFGIFDIQIPLLYGEGKEKAFRRVWKEIEVPDNRLSILNWLTPTDYAPQQNDFIHRWQAGTGQWLLNSKDYQTWLEAKGQTLFCRGIPGAGKTILTSVVVDDLSTRPFKDPIGLAYIYCNFRRQDEQTIDNLLANLLKQLASSQPSLHESVKALYDQHQSRQTRPSLNEISRALQLVATIYSRIFLVIDALDECQSSDGCRTKLLAEIFQLEANLGANIFVTSRHIPEVTESFEGKILFEIRAHDEDVQRYLDSRISESGKKLLQANREKIKKTVTNAVDGMFLLAQLHFESLCTKTSLKKIKARLNSLSTGPRAYDDAYEDAMQRIKDQGPDSEELAKASLLWIICAKRPLTTIELRHALAIEVGELEFDNENLPQIEDIVSVCVGLVTVDKESNIIRLVHYTTQEYFERTKQQWFPNAESEVTIACVTYLALDVFSSGFCQTDDEFEERLRLNPLYDYAAHNWGFHARAIPVCDQLVIDFLNDTAKTEASSQALLAEKKSWRVRYSQYVPMKMVGLHLAAYFGVYEAVKSVLPHWQKVDLKDSYGRTPLSWAASNGYEAVVRLLLATERVDVDGKDNHGQTPLSWAASNGYEAVVRLLLATEGVDVDGKDNYGQTPLSWAAGKGYEAVVRLLLATEEIDINGKDDYGRTPLSWAVLNGYEAVVRLLLATEGVDVDAKDDYHGQTPLLWAAGNGHEAVVRLLLATEGVDVNAKDDNYGQTPLSWAAERGHEAVVRLLLAIEGVDVDAKDDYYGRTSLSWAAGNGHEAVVRLLESYGAESS